MLFSNLATVPCDFVAGLEFHLARCGFPPRGALHQVLGLRSAAEMRQSSAAALLICHVSLLAFHAPCTIHPPFMLHSWCIHGVWVLSCVEVHTFLSIFHFFLYIWPAIPCPFHLPCISLAINCQKSVDQEVKKDYFTIPFSRYSARFVRTLAAAPSEATFAMSASTISFTNCSKVVLAGFHPNLALALVGSPHKFTTSVGL